MSKEKSLRAPNGGPLTDNHLYPLPPRPRIKKGERSRDFCVRNVTHQAEMVITTRNQVSRWRSAITSLGKENGKGEKIVRGVLGDGAGGGSEQRWWCEKIWMRETGM